MKLCTVCNNHFDDKFEVCLNDAAPLIYIGKQPLIDTVVGNRYKVMSAVGAGSMGVVYKAVQITTGREMAIKVLHGGNQGADSAHVRRFRREARAVSVLSHENIVRLYDFGFMDDTQPYIVTEFVRGKTLAQILRDRGRLTITETLPLMRQVCDAVEEAHRLKIVHRDLKPENIILQEPDQRVSLNTKAGWRVRRIKVVDFGVAKLSSDANNSSASLTVEGKVCGSPGYMSPEQCKGLPVDTRSDIYSLGIVLFEMLAGQRPFSADSVMGLLFMHVNETPPPLNAVCLELTMPQGLEAVIMKSLRKNPDDRQQTVGELWQEFEAACHGKMKNAPATAESKRSMTNWIPFSGIENKIIQDDVRKLTGSVSTADAVQAIDPLEQLHFDEGEYFPAAPEFEQHEFDHERMPWLTRPVKISIALGALLLVVLLAVDWLPKRVSLGDPDLKQADALIQKGKLGEALFTIEHLKKQKQMTNEELETINVLYMAVAEKFEKKGDYQDAIETLQRVPSKSKYYQPATKQYLKFRKLLSEQSGGIR